MSRFAILWLVVSSVAFADIIPLSRRDDWTYAGAGGIPTNRTQCRATRFARGNGLPDTANIQGDVNACGANQYVNLACGLFTIPDGDFILLKINNVTLRGCGPGPCNGTYSNCTLLQRTDGAKADTETGGRSPTPIIIAGPQQFDGPLGTGTNLGLTVNQGATSVTINTSGFLAGQYVLLDELSGASWQTDPSGQATSVWADADWKIQWALHKPQLSGDDPLCPTTPTSGPGGTADISSASENGTQVTITTCTDHGFSNGQSVNIWDVGGTQSTSAYNGLFTISNVTHNTFTYTTTSGLTSQTGNCATAPAGHVYNCTTCVAGGGQGGASCWFSRQDRPSGEWHRISSVGVGTVNFDTKVHGKSYRTTNTAQLYLPSPTFVEGVGIENLAVRNGDSGNIVFQWCAKCWMKNVDNSVWLGYGVDVSNATRIEIRDSYLHDAAWPSPGGGGYAIALSNGASEVLIENNIVTMANKMIVANSAGAGSVVGYNYADDAFINYNGNWQEAGLNASHFVGSNHVLFEGNYSFNFESDDTHGNANYHTIFRNYLKGLRKSFVNIHAPSASWVANHTYAIGDRVWGASPQNGNACQCKTGGQSGSTAPDCSLSGDISDGSVVWNSIGIGTPTTMPGQTFDDSSQTSVNGPLRTAGVQYNTRHMSFAGNTLGFSTMSGPTWVTNGCFGGPTCGNASIWLIGWNDHCDDNGANCYPVDGNTDTTQHGNYDYLGGAIVWDPNNSDHMLSNVSSYYLSARPSFFTCGVTQFSWPWVTPEGATPLQNNGTMPAKARFDAGQPFTCQ